MTADEESGLLRKGGADVGVVRSRADRSIVCVALGVSAILALIIFPPSGHIRPLGTESEQSSSLSVSPWCTDPHHPATPGMYGPSRGAVDLVGPKGPLGQYVDVPSDPTTISLFRQGLTQLWGFNNVESLRNFESAAERSPDCALCHWGVAASYGPNINYVVEDQEAFNGAMGRAMEAASRQAAPLTAKSRVLLEAYSELAIDPSVRDDSERAARALDRWAERLCAEADSSSAADADIDSLCAGALMAITPWNYYEGSAGGTTYPLSPHLVPAKAKLLVSVEGGDDGSPHALAIHLLIHLLEPTTAPEEYRWQALRPALLLYNGTGSSTGKEGSGDGGLVPSQGHLSHMPAHLFLRTGLYVEGVAASAVAVDDNIRYAERCLSPYAYAHNLKMLVAHARMAGMFYAAAAYSRLAAEDAAGGNQRTPAGNVECLDCAGRGSPLLVLTLARWGRWDEVLDVPLPTDGDWGHPELAGYHEAAFGLARALAWYGLADGGRGGRRDGGSDDDGGASFAAKGDREARRSVNAAPCAFSETNIFNATAHFGAELRAVRAWRIERDYGAAIRALEDLVAADDSNPYIEPPVWYYPPRQCLGVALLLAPEPARDAPRALEVFRKDLEAFPENAWSLNGAADAMESLGRVEEAQAYREREKAAWRTADTPFDSPCPQLVL
eukprot:CAMPEP_0197440608 /NCGR_PEP_ID=MMETSP1175-20131217/7060_1 /TAXON_ID=1003142 /ORGANISM="Triceratium dubium, Strain CCMP147" /LENGTH=669 /DNA_ID=CAMNT_0042970743 /DNA_START=90 /DNA_END=2099 /DNA_ORIENTATION=-